MREILFRGKQFYNGRWIHGGLVERDGRVFIVGVSSLLRIDGIEVDPKTVSQYTGLTDKNGVKVFENDIVRDCSEENEVFVVKYYAHGGYPAFDVEPEMHCDCNGLSYLMELGSAEVIGNIFDNPKLLKGGAE